MFDTPVGSQDIRICGQRTLIEWERADVRTFASRARTTSFTSLVEVDKGTGTVSHYFGKDLVGDTRILFTFDQLLARREGIMCAVDSRGGIADFGVSDSRILSGPISKWYRDSTRFIIEQMYKLGLGQ